MKIYGDFDNIERVRKKLQEESRRFLKEACYEARGYYIEYLLYTELTEQMKEAIISEFNRLECYYLGVQFALSLGDK